MRKVFFSDLSEVKKENCISWSEDIRTWLRVDASRTQKDFAEKAGFSLRTLQEILAYDGTGEEPNWTRKVRDGIYKVLDCEAWYTVKHKI